MKSNLIAIGLLLGTITSVSAMDNIKGNWTCEHKNGDETTVVIKNNYFDFINQKGAKLSTDMHNHEININFEVSLLVPETTVQLIPNIRQIDDKTYSLNYTTSVDTPNELLKRELGEGLDILSYYAKLIKRNYFKLAVKNIHTGFISDIASCSKILERL